MPTYTEEEIKKRFDKLPDPLKQAVFSADIADIMVAIGKKYALTVEQIGFLAGETGYIILGLTRPEDFTNAIKEKLQTDDTASKAIATDISQQVLAPLRDTLKSAYQFDIPVVSTPPPALEPKTQSSAPLPSEPLMPERLGRVEEPTPKKELPAFLQGFQKISSDIPKKDTPPENKPLPTDNVIMPRGEARSSAPAPIPINPPAPPVKIPPIDLRNQAKPTAPSLAPTISSASSAKPTPIPVAKTQPQERLVTQQPAPTAPAEKKMPDKGVDTYREPVE